MTDVVAFSVFAFLVNICANGDPLDHDNKCKNGGDPVTTTLDLISGRGGDMESGNVDYIARITVDGRVIASIPADVLPDKTVKLMQQNIVGTVKRMNQCHDDVESVCIERSGLNNLRKTLNLSPVDFPSFDHGSR